MVVADILAAWLLSVAGEVGLLVSPDALCCQDQDGDAEDEEDREPDLSQTGGVFVYTSQLGVQRSPTHFGKEDSLRGKGDLGRETVES